MNFDAIKKFIKRSATENLRLKLIAAVIALLLYFVVMSQAESERLIDVEIVPMLPQPATSLVLANEPPDRVRVRLRGPRSRITSLRPGDIPPIAVDLSQFQEGTSQYYFNEEDFDIPQGCHFVRVTPESVPIRLERLISRQVPIRVRTYGKLKAGTEFAEEPTIAPTHVEITGPVSAMRGIDAIETEDVYIEDLDVGQHVHVISARRPDGVQVRGGDELKVTTKVRWIPGQRMISGLLVQVPDTELTVEVKPKEVALALAGPQIVLDRLDPAKISPVVILDAEQKTKVGIYRGDVTVRNLPPNVSLISAVPTRVRVKLLVPITADAKHTAAKPKSD